MNKKLLALLEMRLITEEHSKHFDIRTYFNVSHTLEPFILTFDTIEKVVRENYNHCGTTACIVGHLKLIQPTMNILESAEELELTKEQDILWQLVIYFHTSWWITEEVKPEPFWYNDIDSLMAADVIRHMRLRNEVPTSWDVTDKWYSQIELSVSTNPNLAMYYAKAEQSAVYGNDSIMNVIIGVGTSEDEAKGDLMDKYVKSLGYELQYKADIKS